MDKKATLTGRVASLARHPLDKGRRAKLDRKISEGLVKKVNIPLYKSFTKKNKKGRSFAGDLGGVADFLGIAGEPGKAGRVKKRVVGRMAARALADNPELFGAYAAPIPYLGTAIAVGKKRAYKLIGAKTPAQVRQGMEKRRRNKMLGAAAGVTALGVAAKKKKKLSPEQKAKKEMDDRLVGIGRTLQKLAMAKTGR